VKRLSLLVLVFAVVSLVFFLLPVFLRIPFALYPLVSGQDVVDLFTPLVLAPILWLLFKYGARRQASLAEELAFLAFAAIWVAGHGMHLAANSVHNLAENQAIEHTGTGAYQLFYFYDEHLSHTVGHAGLLGLAGLLI
jgi:hypothetical protein